MKLIKEKTYLFFIVLSLLWLMLVLTIPNGESIDINVHDTYFVIYGVHFCVFFMTLSLLAAFVYYFFKVIKIRIITILVALHFGLMSIGSFFTMYSILKMWNNKSNGKLPTRYIENYIENPLFDDLVDFNIIITIGILMIVIAQMFFIFNISISIFRKLIGLINKT